MDLEKLRYPIGRFQMAEQPTAQQIQTWIDEIEKFPSDFRQIAESLTEEQLNTPYRADGWTIRQVIHHVADSHINSYIRFRWALTENAPTIKAYDETLWAELLDAKTAPIALSLNLLESLHQRWVILLRSFSEADLQKAFVHPESGKTIPLYKNIALYAWHGKHHLGHLLLMEN